jgi:UDP-N-acetylmuramoyl-L-alanyl-D-glutamate--2,6-diaminopimelate ligase
MLSAPSSASREGAGALGVTGTNGKTTTTYLIDAALRAAGHKVGLLGTVQYRIGDRLADATRTTPEASDLQALFREMVDAGCSHAVLEVSSTRSSSSAWPAASSGWPYSRTSPATISTSTATWTRTFQAKRKLFAELVRPDGAIVINADDDRAAELAAASRAPVWTYGLDKPADFRAEDVRLALDGTRFRVESPWARTR